MPEVNLNVKLLSHTPDAETLTAMAAKLCYSPSGIDGIADGLTEDKAAAFIEKIVDLGHLSTIEHVSFSFGIEGRVSHASGTDHAAPYREFFGAVAALRQLFGKRL